MKNKIKTLLLFCGIFFSHEIRPFTTVYSLKIRRAFNVPNKHVFGDKSKKHHFILSLLPIVFSRKRHIVEDTALKVNLFEKTLLAGSVLNLRYVSKHWWAEFTTALEKESTKAHGTSKINISKAGFDDIALTFGYNKSIGKDYQIVFYGLAGFPTHTKVTLQETYNTLIGTRFYVLGLGSEFSFDLVNQLKQSFTCIIQARFLHFFNRHWTPILPQNAKIQPGNTTDLLFTFQYRNKANILELGYNPTFFTNQAILLANEKISGQNFLRNSIYITLSHFYKKTIFKRPLLLGIGAATSTSKLFDMKSATGWVNISFIF